MCTEEKKPSPFKWTILTSNKNELKQQAAFEELPSLLSMPLPLLPQNPVKDFHAVTERVGGSNETFLHRRKTLIQMRLSDFIRVGGAIEPIVEPNVCQPHAQAQSHVKNPIN